MGKKLCRLGLLLLAIVVVGGILYAWVKAGGLCEITPQSEKRFDSLIALFTSLAFAGVILTLLFQFFQFKRSTALQLKAAEASERAAIANQNSAEIAERNLNLQQKITEQENNLAFIQLNIQYKTLCVQGLHRSVELAIMTRDSQGMQDVIPEIKKLMKDIETLTLSLKRYE